MRIRAGVAVGLCVFAVVAGAACGSGSSDHASPTSSSTPGPTLSSGIAKSDYDRAVGRVKDEWGKCLALVHVSTTGAKMAPAATDPKTGKRVRQDYRPVVVELASGQQFLIELDSGGADGAAPFNRAADQSLKAAKAKNGDCG